MLSKAQIKFIDSLRIKKIREKNSLFIAEGEKIIEELLLSSFKIKYLFATESWIKANAKKIKKGIDVMSLTGSELKKISALSTPNEVLAIVEIEKQKIDLASLSNELTLVLDNIRDPGNFGTIIRVADWFGIKNIICSNETVDVYNAKTVQSTMGSISRVNIFYTDLIAFLSQPRLKNIPVYGAFLEGENIYTKKFTGKGFILIGNESQGISKKLYSLITDKISIPTYNTQSKSAESLNAAIATAVICAELKRQGTAN